MQRAIFILLVPFLFSCSKMLDQEPTHVIEGSHLFKTIDDLEASLTGAYQLSRNHYLYRITTYPDIMSDNFSETPESFNSFPQLVNWTYSSNDFIVYPTWLFAYKAVMQANIVIGNSDRFMQQYPGAVHRIRGQALALRALVHFDILRFWGAGTDRYSQDAGIPYILVSDVNATPARHSVKESYDRIEADLKLAMDLLGNTDRPVNTVERAYIDQHVVHAALARMYLTAGQHDSAIHYATLVINQFPLASQAQFPMIWRDASTAEVLWSIIYNTNEGWVGNIYYSPTIDRSSFAPNQDLLASYDPLNDIRYPSYFMEKNGRIVFSKYLARQAAIDKPDGIVNFKAFRSGEMYLLRAEAYARAGNDAAARDDLNALRSARISGYVPVSLSGAALLDAIGLERRKELVGEGHRWFDLKRLQQPVQRTSCSSNCVLPVGHRAWNWPIPDAEMQVNPNMIQNNGY